MLKRKKVFENVISLTHCKDCHKKLKDVHHKLTDKKGLFIGYRCSKCYKKYESYIAAFIVFKGNKTKLDRFKDLHDEQNPYKPLTKSKINSLRQ